MNSDHDAEAIRSLIGRAALLADEGDPDDYRTVYAADAEWTFGSVVQRGITEIVGGATTRRADGVSGPGTATRHLVVPQVIEVQGETATAVSYFVFLGTTTDAPTPLVVGTYRDALVRRPEGWRIIQRVATQG